ncbi:hypothetical protein CEXT_421481 [Caerostris extrusa]|uniref:Uncharacterized protein n=1 Tax=Caerostris extrusa TaxID=172846 RepID=A0AAV4RVR7_CAEEX|nr:hypothetical protein CEXT_421481 [Caerostris extrusa]
MCLRQLGFRHVCGALQGDSRNGRLSAEGGKKKLDFYTERHLFWSSSRAVFRCKRTSSQLAAKSPHNLHMWQVDRKVGRSVELCAALHIPHLVESLQASE